MNKIINRNLSLEFDLDELAKDFSYNLEVDSFDDVYHNGYSKKDIKNLNLRMPDKYEGLENIFPECVAMALEDAERDAWASLIRKKRIEALKDCLEKIDLLGGGAEYVSVEGVDVSAKAGITSAEIDEANNKVIVNILNPEHLINAVINGVGYIYPDLPAQVEASNDEIKKRFHNLKDYFEVYGESKPSGEVDNRESPDVDNENFKEQLDFRVGELTLEDAIQALKEATIENDDIKNNMSLVAKFTDFKEAEVAQALLNEVQDSAKNWTDKVSTFLDNLSSQEIKESLSFALSNLIDNNNENPSVGVFSVEQREKYPKLKELNFRLSFSEVDQEVVCLYRGDDFLIKEQKHKAVEEFSLMIAEELA